MCYQRSAAARQHLVCQSHRRWLAKPRRSKPDEARSSCGPWVRTVSKRMLSILPTRMQRMRAVTTPTAANQLTVGRTAKLQDMFPSYSVLRGHAQAQGGRSKV